MQILKNADVAKQYQSQPQPEQKKTKNIKKAK